MALALPWLEAMTPEKPAQAAAPPAKRFVGIYTPGGTVLENWRPTGTENAFTLSKILQPLAPVQDRIMPFLLAGNGGGLRTNRWVQNNHASHNNLLVSILNLCGDPRTTFGNAEFCTGPLGGLT